MARVAAAYAADAAALEARASALEGDLRRRRDPFTRTWPGPDRAGAEKHGLYLAAMARRTLARETAQMRAAADNAARLARALQRATGGCAEERFCRDPEDVAQRSSAGELREDAVAPRCRQVRADLDEVLARLRPAIGALDTAAKSCAALACPSAECGARTDLLEEASFGATLLAALGHPRPEPDEFAASAKARQDIAVSAQKTLARISGAVTPAGPDKARLGAIARALAKSEAALADLRDAPDKPLSARDPAWRATAAKFALAGVRDALGRLQLAEERKDAGDTYAAIWDATAERAAAATLALARFAAAPQPQPRSPSAACFSADEAILATPVRDIRAAIDATASCSLRAGCGNEEALARGRDRAAVIIESKVLEGPLDILRALDEELRIGPALEAARAAEAPPAAVVPDLEGYTEGEAITLAVDPADNRCLADGGFVLFTPMPDTPPPPALSVEDVADVTDRLRISGQEAETLLFAAPGRGRHLLRVFAGLEYGGREVGRAAIDVTRGPPQACAGFTGTWLTEFGTLVTVERRNGFVRGTYRRTAEGRPGFLVGHRAGDRFIGEWASEFGAGGVRLELFGDGVFRGTWGFSPAEVTGGGVWSGICAPAAEAPTR